jgi:hypothetical protein
MKEYALYDRKTIVIEKLEQSAKYDPYFVMINVKFWDVTTFELSDLKEIFVHKDRAVLNDIGTEIGAAFNIPVNVHKNFIYFRLQKLIVVKLNLLHNLVKWICFQRV